MSAKAICGLTPPAVGESRGPFQTPDGSKGYTRRRRIPATLWLENERARPETNARKRHNSAAKRPELSESVESAANCVNALADYGVLRPGFRQRNSWWFLGGNRGLRGFSSRNLGEYDNIKRTKRLRNPNRSAKIAGPAQGSRNGLCPLRPSVG